VRVRHICEGDFVHQKTKIISAASAPEKVHVSGDGDLDWGHNDRLCTYTNVPKALVSALTGKREVDFRRDEHSTGANFRA